MNNKIVVIAAIAATIAGLIALAFYSMSSTSVAPGGKHTPAQKQVPVTKQSPDPSSFVRWHSPRFGNSSSRVTVVQWLFR